MNIYQRAGLLTQPTPTAVNGFAITGIVRYNPGVFSETDFAGLNQLICRLHQAVMATNPQVHMQHMRATDYGNGKFGSKQPKHEYWTN